MRVTIHYTIGMKSEHVKPALDRTQALAEEMRGKHAKPLAVPFAIRRLSSTKLMIDIGGCETLTFNFNAYRQYLKDAEGQDGRQGWSYEQSVSSRTFNARVLSDQELAWTAAFCKTQFAETLTEHRWVAELIRSVASVANYAHVYDEGDYYHTLAIEDAAKAIHANGLQINSIGSILHNLAGDGIHVVQGGETKIKPIRKQSDVADHGTH